MATTIWGLGSIMWWPKQAWPPQSHVFEGLNLCVDGELEISCELFKVAVF